jgi:hypothetical protein
MAGGITDAASCEMEHGRQQRQRNIRPHPGGEPRNHPKWTVGAVFGAIAGAMVIEDGFFEALQGK